MTENKEFLKKLLALPGLSGFEDPIREVIAETWRPLADELSVSRIGSLQALKKGTADAPRPSILLSGHMDAIGLIVTQVVDGFIRFTEIGGIDPRILPGQPVTVHGRRDLPARVVMPPAWLLPAGYGPRDAVAMKYLLIDTGLLPEETAALVQVGDVVSFAQEPLELSDDALAGHSLDDRAAVVSITACLQELQHVRHEWDVWAVASVQEEETLGGAFTSPFSIRPQIAVAIDVTFAKGPGGPSDYRTFPLGKGITLGWGPNIHPKIFNTFKDLAERLDIPYQIEVMPRHSGTDAMGLQVVAEGIPTMVIGIPLRYMHTPVELVSMKDIARAGHLMAEMIANLKADFVEKIRWEDEK